MNTLFLTPRLPKEVLKRFNKFIEPTRSLKNPSSNTRNAELEYAIIDLPRPQGEAITFNFGKNGRILAWPKAEGNFSEEQLLERIRQMADRPQSSQFDRNYRRWRETDDELTRLFLYRAAEGSLRAEQHEKKPRYGTMVYDESTIQLKNALSREEADLDADKLMRILQHARDKGVKTPWTG